MPQDRKCRERGMTGGTTAINPRAMRTWHRPPVRARPPTHRNDTDTDTPAPHRPTRAAEASKVQRRPGINLPALQWPLPDTAWLKSPDTDGHPVRHALFPCTGYGLRWTPLQSPGTCTDNDEKQTLPVTHPLHTDTWLTETQRHRLNTPDHRRFAEMGPGKHAYHPHVPICYTAANIFVLCMFLFVFHAYLPTLPLAGKDISYNDAYQHITRIKFCLHLCLQTTL